LPEPDDSLLSSVPEEWGPKFVPSSGAVTRTLKGPYSIKFSAPGHMALVMLRRARMVSGAGTRPYS